MEKLERGICIEFCFKLEKSCAETIEIMTAFGDKCMGNTQIKEWYNSFKDSRRSVDSDLCSRQPSTAKTNDNIERVQHKINKGHQLTV